MCCTPLAVGTSGARFMKGTDMNAPRISVVPDGDLFKNVTVSVIQIDPEWIPDLDLGGAPDEFTATDRGLKRLQKAMGGRTQRGLDEVRAALDWPPGQSRKELGMSIREGEPSDISMAAVLLRPDSPFALQYELATKRPPHRPDGITVVLWRGHLYERHGDILTLWSEE